MVLILVRFNSNYVRLGLSENGVDHLRPDFLYRVPFPYLISESKKSEAYIGMKMMAAEPSKQAHCPANNQTVGKAMRIRPHIGNSFAFWKMREVM